MLRWRKSKSTKSDKFALMDDDDHVAGFDGVLIPNSVNNFEMVSMAEPKPLSEPRTVIDKETKDTDDDVDLLFFGEAPRDVRPPIPLVKPPPASRGSKYDRMNGVVTAVDTSDDLIGIPPKPKKETVMVFEPRSVPTVFEPIPVMLLYKKSGNVRFEGFIDKDGVAIGYGTEFTDTPYLLPIYRGTFKAGLYDGNGETYDTRTNLKQTIGLFENGRIKEGHIYLIKDDSIRIKIITNGSCMEEHTIEGGQMIEMLTNLTTN